MAEHVHHHVASPLIRSLSVLLLKGFHTTGSLQIKCKVSEKSRNQVLISYKTRNHVYTEKCTVHAICTLHVHSYHHTHSIYIDYAHRITKNLANLRKQLALYILHSLAIELAQWSFDHDNRLYTVTFTDCDHV